MPAVGGADALHPTALIDYISLTLPGGALLPWDYEAPGEGLRGALALLLRSKEAAAQFMSTGWVQQNGFSGFRVQYVFADGGCRVLVGHSSGRLMLVLSGGGCAVMAALDKSRGGELWKQFFQGREQANWTRLDLSIDVPTDLKPNDILHLINPKRTRRVSYDDSDTGDTFYFGSRHSDQYLCVYKFRPPHPRHKTMRFEWRLAGNHAKQAGQALAEPDGLIKLLRGLIQAYGVGYAPVAGHIGTGETSVLAHQKRERAGKLRWLLKVCIPALRDALHEGIIDAEAVSALIRPFENE